MPDFAKQIDQKIKSASKINEFIASIRGGGYILQLLYQMDNSMKEEVVESCLEKVLESNEVFEKTCIG